MSTSLRTKIAAAIVALFTALHVAAMPAKPGLLRITQPDGTEVTISLHGDEFLHFNTTSDGYTVVRDDRGYYVYAAVANGELIPTTHVAHDAASRDAAELHYVSTLQRYLSPGMTTQTAERKKVFRAAQADTRQAYRAPNYDYSKLRGLIILVEYNDQSFSRSDYKDIISEMVNTENYTGYYNTNGRFVQMTGSVHDYYAENSGGVFKPEFDIVGPVKVDRSRYYANGTNASTQLMKDAVNAADDLVDFSKYDGDKDGIIDMVYFIFAGCGSNINGNDSRLLWPHAGLLVNWSWGGYTYIIKDGKKLYRYACSTEMTGTEANPQLDGIGTICHEFTHVLGLPDFYDTDYAGSGGEADHPGAFDIMASGGYLNDGKTPCAYTLFERYAMGFSTPKLISGEGSFELKSINECNSGYRINSPNQQEYFLLENRQNTKWDRYVPSFGMCVYRVDSTNTKVWDNNEVNINPKHMYFELLRAGGYPLATTFPGNIGKTELSHATTPANLLTWSGQKTRLGLMNIKDVGGVITFDVFDTFILKELSLPATLTIGTGLERTLVATATPSYAEYKLTWTSANTSIATVDNEGHVRGIAPGTTTVTVRSDNGLEATTTVIVEQQNIFADMADCIKMSDDTEGTLLLNNAQVVFTYKNDAYVRDASGAIMLNNIGLSLKAGDVLNGTLYAKLTRTNGMPALQKVSGQTTVSEITVTEGDEPQPRKVQMRDLSEADYCDLVRIVDTQWISDGGIYAVYGSKRVRLFNPFQIKNISVPTGFSGKFYDLIGIYGTNTVKNVGTVNEIKLITSPIEVPIPEGIEAVSAQHTPAAAAYNLEGQRVNSNYRGIVVTAGKKHLSR